MQPKSGYEQAAAYWREQYEIARAEADFLKEQLTDVFGSHEKTASDLRAYFRMRTHAADMLACLLRCAPRHVSKQALYESLNTCASGTQIIDVTMVFLRRDLKHLGFNGVLHTVWGYGYYLEVGAAKAIKELLEARARLPAPKAEMRNEKPVQLSTLSRKTTVAA